MKTVILSLIVVLYLLCPSMLSAQLDYEFNFKDTTRKKIKIHFKCVNNLIIIPLHINNSDTLFFILDTGVSQPIITDLRVQGELVLNFGRTSKIYGLGVEQPIEVIHSFNNEIKINDYASSSQNIYLLLQSKINLSSSLGTMVHGLIGYSVFKNAVVEINYDSKIITLHNPKYYKAKRAKRKYSIVPLKIFRNKPYVAMELFSNDTTAASVNMLIDTGSSDALWLFDTEKNKKIRPEKLIPAYLGEGLSGVITGSLGRYSSFKIGQFELKHPIVAFPDSLSINSKYVFNSRNGSIGGEVLRHFKVVFDYKNKRMMLSPSRLFKNKFDHNMAGLEIIAPVPDFPHFEISRVYPYSPAYNAGLKAGDQVVSINHVPNSDMSLGEINETFRSSAGKKIKIKILRNGETMLFKFELEKRI